MIKPLYLLFFMISAICLAVTGNGQNKDQQSSGNKFEYYIQLSGVNTKSDVISIEENISARPGIYFFMADRFPANYFTLKTSIPVSQSEFRNWLNNNNYSITFFGEGLVSKEKLLLSIKKTPKNK
jgi:hypothetical protein